MQARDHVFKIQHLRCQYNAGVTVLNLESLDIPRGDLVFVVGKSGIGKSTFIETLGLMNNTIAPGSSTSIQFYPGMDEPLELSSIWQLPNERLSSIRRKHFSFIFQNTNLMSNFTSGENMMVSLLIKGKSKEEAKKEVLSVMEKLSLEKGLFDKRISEISGGQRQRLAFARAITADFSVLFGDEPTGNLDENTSAELMLVLKQLTLEHGKTGVIVSHNLPLTEQFADMIIPITSVTPAGQNTRMGEVIASNVLRKSKSGWVNATGEHVSNISQLLNHYLTPES